ncbi:hypothetical protein [Streptacidiphilus carbonis]|uniref:hypothetical protein n=1 Tax=Streptacidiphilus carbonis TaxID=105422 RepID=UPI0005AAD696|nr:hypothetical protein [Streptacidiphilus carbonis]
MPAEFTHDPAAAGYLTGDNPATSLPWARPAACARARCGKVNTCGRAGGGPVVVRLRPGRMATLIR